MPFLGHLPELIIVVALALLVFGPKRLPDMAGSIGTAIKEFRKTMSEVTEPRQASLPSTPQLDAAKTTVDAETSTH
jgi:sec-independent protein translocase protein TatA